MTRLRDSQAGLTLIETLAALTVFSLITLGVTPLIATTIRGSAVSRSYTIGKQVAQEAMERVRGLPFFESSGSAVPLSNPPPAGSRKDVLDFWFPNRTAGTTYSPGAPFTSVATGFASDKFTTVCTSSTKLPAPTAPLICPSGLPPGYELDFTAEFVVPSTATTPQTFTTKTPGATYNWNSTATEFPPAQLVRMAITSKWAYQGRLRSFTLTSLIGNRKLTKQDLRAEGKVDFLVQAATSYLDGAGKTSTMTVTGGVSDSAIDTRSITGADFAGKVGDMGLSFADFNGEPGDPPTTTAGATSTLHAPPNSSPASDVTSGELTFVHPSLVPATNIAFVNDAKIKSSGVQVVADQPKAFGSFDFFEGVGQDNLWLDSQAERGLLSPLQLASSGNRPMLSVKALGSTRLTGSTYAESTSVASGARKVEATAAGTFGELDLLPTTFLSSSGPVLKVTNFTASLGCKSTASAGTAVVTGTWSATLMYWSAGVDGDGLPADRNDDGYITLALSGNLIGGTDPLVALKASNPLVYDDLVDDNKDVYLFRDAATNKKGYLVSASSAPKIESSKDATGRQTNASLNGAISIETVPTDAGKPDSAISVSIGKLSCLSVDSRGL